MSIDPTQAVAPLQIPVARPATTPAAASSTAANSNDAYAPNPRIEFDPKLRLVVLEFRNDQNNTVNRYPNAAPPPAPAGSARDITA